MPINSIRDGITLYKRSGHSDADSHRVGNAKASASYRRDLLVTDKVMDRLKLSSAVGKTIDRLCDKGNQMDSVFDTRGMSTYRMGVLRRNDQDGDFIHNRYYSGNCGEMANFAEHILAAVNSERASYNRRHPDRSPRDVMPITVAEWEGDHVFAMIGDPRASPQTSVVAVDGWVMRPSAQTLNKVGFIGSLHVHSSTEQQPASFLDAAINRKSTGSIERSSLGHERNSRERQAYYERLLSRVGNGDMHIWDHQYSDQRMDTVNYYASESQAPINFDYLPRNQLSEKRHIHRLAANSSLATQMDHAAESDASDSED